jgi:hypothetical protein
MIIRDYFRLTLWPCVCLPLTLGVVAVYWLVRRSSPDGVTGGSTLGLWYGLLGWLLFVGVALVLPLHRRWLTQEAKADRPAKAPTLRLGWFAPRLRSWWLQAHAWLSVLASVLILCHASFRFGGRVESVLMVSFYLMLLTGVGGVLIQSVIPGWLRGPDEVPIGQLPARCQELRARADDLIDRLLPSWPEPARLESEYTALRRHLDERFPLGYPLWLLLGDPFRRLTRRGVRPEVPAALIGDLQQLREVWLTRRDYARQQWLHLLLHGWIVPHILVSLFMLVLGLWHGLVCVAY